MLLAAKSISASSITITGALPPSSRTTGLIAFPHKLAIIRPTLVEPVMDSQLNFVYAGNLPVKLIFRINGCSMIAFVI